METIKMMLLDRSYEPGSVFKAFSVAIGIDTGEITPDDTYYDRGYVELDVGGSKPIKISNVSRTCIGRHTYLHALNWSCNVGMINIVEKMESLSLHSILWTLDSITEPT